MEDKNSNVSEAEEERELIEEDVYEDEGEGEDLLEDMEKDYKPIPELDNYE